jgi:hypothetical protein
MHNTHNKKVLNPLILEFKNLSKQPFSQQREYDIDNLFAQFLRVKVSSGTKKFDDSTHKNVRTRSFRYQSDDGRCDIIIEMKMYLGQPNQAEFISKAIFRKIQTKTKHR